MGIITGTEKLIESLHNIIKYIQVLLKNQQSSNFNPEIGSTLTNLKSELLSLQDVEKLRNIREFLESNEDFRTLYEYKHTIKSYFDDTQINDLIASLCELFEEICRKIETIEHERCTSETEIFELFYKYSPQFKDDFFELFSLIMNISNLPIGEVERLYGLYLENLETEQLPIH